MIRHVFKLIWNRRRSNGLVLTELFLCFLTLCGCLTMACYYAINWNKPLGFDPHDLWRLDLDFGLGRTVTQKDVDRVWDSCHRLYQQLGNMEEVAAASPLDPNFPYTNSYTMFAVDVNGMRVTICDSPVTPDAYDALGLKLVAGRWLEPGDAALHWMPTVLTRDAARALFGSADPLGQAIGGTGEASGAEESNPDAKERRVVGIVTDFRMRSELRPSYMTAFSPLDLDPAAAHRRMAPGVFAVRTRPGVGAEFEEKLLRAARDVDPRWTATITPVSRLRARELRANLLPLTILAVVAGFLVFMVGLGLIGVLWRAVTRRTEELGIRIALGATAAQVRWQILGEMLALTTVAVLLGSVLFLQMPLLNLIDWLPWQAYGLSLLLSLGILYVFVIVCGLYPSWLATKVQPAEALQHE